MHGRVLSCCGIFVPVIFHGRVIRIVSYFRLSAWFIDVPLLSILNFRVSIYVSTNFFPNP